MKHSKKVTNSFATVSSSFPARSRRGCGHAIPVLAMIGTVVVAAQSAQAQQIFADWEADLCGVGFWTEIKCWGAEAMPNNGNMGFTYVAGISDGNANVTQNIDITLDGLVIFGGVAVNTMVIPDNRILNIVGGPIDGGITGFIDLNDVLLMDAANITVTAGAAGSTLRIVNVDGSGELRMSDHINNRIYGATGSETIIFGSGVTVGGAGQIGLNQTTLINQGIILADQSTELQINPNDIDGMTNSGLMVARDGGNLGLYLAAYDNALGEIRAEDGSTVRFHSGAGIIGGLMVAQSGGLLEFNGCSLSGGTVRIDVGGIGRVQSHSGVSGLTNHGVINHDNGMTLYTTGQPNNTGNYYMNSVGGSTDMRFYNDTVLVGGGTINMSDHINNRILGDSGTQTFTNVDNTIRGSGQIGVNQTTLINQGTIIADQSAEFQIYPNAGGMTNSGTLRAENGAELHLYPGPFTTSGFVFAAAGSTIRRLADDYIQTAGSTIIDGTLALNAGGVATVTLDGGLLGGEGLVSANVNNVSGAASPGSSPGTLTVDGNYTQGIDGECAVEIGGAKPGQFDVLAINDDATLAGTLAVTFINDFDPQIDQSFTILTATGVFGTFDVIDSCAGLSVTYNTDSVVLTITAACAPCPWDLDGDAVVGTGDLILLLGSWGDPYGTADLIELLGAWGACR